MIGSEIERENERRVRENKRRGGGKVSFASIAGLFCIYTRSLLPL